MTTTISPNTYPQVSGSDVSSATPRRSLAAAGLAAGVAAAATTSAVAAAARGLDVSLKVSGFGASSPQPIPVAGFASVTMVGAVLGIALAAASARWARQPVARFVTVAVALTALSLVPGVMGAADAGTLLVLVVAHILAGAIIVPVLVARLRGRSRP